MKILVINCGSSSVKYRLFDVNTDSRELAKGLIERIGTDKAESEHKAGEVSAKETAPIRDYRTGIAKIAEFLKGAGVLQDDLAAVGHRVVHGGEEFRDSVVIDQTVIDQIDRCSQLAPLHNPANLAGIKACQEIFPDIPQVAVFDTAFFHTLPPASYLYALPYSWYEEHRVRRYGFHGTSHRYVSEQAAQLLGKPLAECNLITMHLGNGCSMAAVRQGQAIDTTMGLTPLEGLVMGTRCGDIDTAIVFHMLGVAGMSVDSIRQALEKQSGLLGISGVSRDMRDVTAAAEKGSDRAGLALEIFARRVRKYLGAYMVEVGQADALVFTGGVGENAWHMREMILRDMEHLCIVLDENRNRQLKNVPAGQSISDPRGEVEILVIPTNEELAIARDSHRLVANASPSDAGVS